MRILLSTLLASGLILSGVVAFADEVKSGLEPGDSPAPFVVKDVTGPAKGTSLCYRCRYSSRPVVSIFTRSIDDNLVDLVKKVDESVSKHEDQQMRAFVVLLSDDPLQAEQQLAKVAKTKGITHVPLTIYDGTAGPVEYNLSKKADVTVLMWVHSDVKVNHAFAKGNLDKTSISKIIGDTQKILN